MAKNKKRIDFSHSERVKLRHWPKYSAVFILFLVCSVLAGYLYLVKNIDDGESVSVAQTESKRVNIVRGKQLIDTKYFQFEVEGEWQYREVDSTPDKYYYYSEYKNNRVQRHIRVHVNPTNDRYQAQHIIPVAQTGNRLEVLNYSSPKDCKQQGAEDVRVGERVVVLEGVEFLCDVDAGESRTAAGLRGGGFELSPEKTSLDTPYTLIIEYHDVGFNPDHSVFTRMLDTFRLK